jgi:putative transposase
MEAVSFMSVQGITVNSACAAAGLTRAQYYYVTSKDDSALIKEIESIAYQYPFYGYRKILLELRKHGVAVNHKKCYRLYRNLLLPKKIRHRSRRNLPTTSPQELAVPKTSNDVWAMDFCFRSLRNGRSIKIFAIEDLFSRKALYAKGNTTLPSVDVVAVINHVCVVFGKPKVIRSDNGPEFRSSFTGSYFDKERITHEFIPKGSPYFNGAMERFNRSLKEEKLFLCECETLEELNREIDDYIEFYNAYRPHMSLKGKEPDSVFFDKQY